MAHSFVKVWIHAVFGTKYREPLIAPHLAGDLFDHIKKRLEDDFNCRVSIINGTVDHIHILFLLDSQYAIKDIIKSVKGESSHWINQNGFHKIKFAWQLGYGAYSVSESALPHVEQYIARQREHHRNKTFHYEYEELMVQHGVVCVPEPVKSVYTEKS